MRIFAKAISFIFHPLMILTFIAVILLLINPYLFGKSSIDQGWWILAQVFMTTYLMPAFAVVIMKNLGLIQSLEIEERTERIIPYISTGIFYLWVFMSVKSNNTFPQVFTIAVLGGTISLFLAFFINNFTKVSAHAAGVGGLVGMTLVIMRWFSYSYFYWGIERIEIPVYWILIVVLLIAGLVCSSRLYLKVHEPRDIIQGLIVGLGGTAFATWYFM